MYCNNDLYAALTSLQKQATYRISMKNGSVYTSFELRDTEIWLYDDNHNCHIMDLNEFVFECQARNIEFSVK